MTKPDDVKKLGEMLGGEMGRQLRERIAPVETAIATIEAAIESLDGRVVELSIRPDGEPVKDDAAPLMVRRYTRDEISKPGRLVTLGGQLWQWQGDEATGAAPGTADDWIVVVDRGQDGQSFRWLGAHEKTGDYVAGDCVTCNGASWIAIEDGPGDLPGPGWRLFAQKGEPGGRGKPGKNAEPAAEIVDAIARGDADGTVDFLRSDGETFSVALPITQMIDKAIERHAKIKATEIETAVLNQLTEDEAARDGLVLRFRGSWTDGDKHAAGDLVRAAGGLWVATGDTTARPGQGAHAWALFAREAAK